MTKPNPLCCVCHAPTRPHCDRPGTDAERRCWWQVCTRKACGAFGDHEAGRTFVPAQK
jgi:hypothetical protein